MPQMLRGGLRAGLSSTLVILMIGAIGLACDTEKGTDGASTPVRAVERMLKAIDKGDQDEFLNVLAPELRKNPANALLFLNLNLGVSAGGVSAGSGFGFQSGSFHGLRFQVLKEDGETAVVNATGEFRFLGIATPFDEDTTARRINGRWYVLQ